MGCLLSLVEFIFDEIVFGYFIAMQWIIPKKYLGKILLFIIQCIVGIYSFVLCVAMFVALFGLIFGDAETKEFAVYALLVPLCLSAVQILLGYIVQKITK